MGQGVYSPFIFEKHVKPSQIREKMYIDRCMREYILEYEKEECLAIGIIDMSQ